MKRTYQLKRLLGIDDGIVGVNGRGEHEAHECTRCKTQFATMETSCPECGSRIYRTRTVIPHAGLNLLVILAASGLGVAYNVVKGDVPKKSPKEQ